MNSEQYNIIEAEFDGVNAFQCNHCGNLVVCEADLMEEHLDQCEEFKGKYRKEYDKQMNATEEDEE